MVDFVIGRVLAVEHPFNYFAWYNKINDPGIIFISWLLMTFNVL